MSEKEETIREILISHINGHIGIDVDIDIDGAIDDIRAAILKTKPDKKAGEFWKTHKDKHFIRGYNEALDEWEKNLRKIL